MEEDRDRLWELVDGSWSMSDHSSFLRTGHVSDEDIKVCFSQWLARQAAITRHLPDDDVQSLLRLFHLIAERKLRVISRTAMRTREVTGIYLNDGGGVTFVLD